MAFHPTALWASTSWQGGEAGSNSPRSVPVSTAYAGSSRRPVSASIAARSNRLAARIASTRNSPQRPARFHAR